MSDTPISQSSPAPASQDDNLRPKSVATTAAKTVLVTVHGTGAGDVANTGSQWWQLKSPFEQEVGKRLDLARGGVIVDTHQWKLGPNEESERRQAGRRLFEKLRAYDRAGQDYYLIGHSHGGSVIYNALLYSIGRKEPLERLKQWCTVGTPFLDYRPNKRLHDRLGNTGLTIYATGVGALLFAVLLMAMSLTGATPFWNKINEILGAHRFVGLYVPLTILFVLYGLACVGALYASVRLRGGWYTSKQKQAVEKVYGERWLGLWHGDDEAISALSNIRYIKGDIIPSTFLVPFVAAAPLLLTIAAVLYVAWLMLASPSEPPKFVTSFMQDLKGQVSAMDNTLGSSFSPANIAGLARMFGILVAIIASLTAVYVGVASLVVFLIAVIVGWIGMPLARLLDGLVWSSIRKRAWGDDMVREDLWMVASVPPEFRRSFQPLPKSIAAQLSENSEKNAVITLTRVRELLGMTKRRSSEGELRADLAKHLQWKELIHTTYFDNQDFINLLTYALHRAGLAPLAVGFWQEGVINAVRQSLAEIEAAPTTTGQSVRSAGVAVQADDE